ncbi:MAG: hypothetical protein H6Q72_1236 [Firmicutes bacterium]|nr:hypothetical protein [Bacillota bacterium]
MKPLAKKTVIYTLVAIMQSSVFAVVAEAAPNYNSPQQIVELDRRDHHNYREHREYERRREHDERMRREHERHEREMRRRHHESEREWHERRERERERHDRELRDIAAILIGIVIGSASND